LGYVNARYVRAGGEKDFHAFDSTIASRMEEGSTVVDDELFASVFYEEGKNGGIAREGSPVKGGESRGIHGVDLGAGSHKNFDCVKVTAR
jgi:hypothetical protein